MFDWPKISSQGVEEKMQAKFLFPPAVMTRIKVNLLASFNFYQRGHITQLKQKVNTKYRF